MEHVTPTDDAGDLRAQLAAVTQEKLRMYEEAEHVAGKALARLQRLEQQLAADQSFIDTTQRMYLDAVMQKNIARQQLATSQARCAQYDELIMAVASKYPNETRHQTALRYIKERENQCDGPVQASTERTPT